MSNEVSGTAVESGKMFAWSVEGVGFCENLKPSKEDCEGKMSGDLERCFGGIEKSKVSGRNSFVKLGCGRGYVVGISSEKEMLGAVEIESSNSGSKSGMTLGKSFDPSDVEGENGGRAGESS